MTFDVFLFYVHKFITIIIIIIIIIIIKVSTALLLVLGSFLGFLML
jgi:hypothetical protein